MNKTSIEWTDTTWNPVRGCSRVSEGCRNCYAEKMAARFSDEGMPYEGLAKRNPAHWTGKVRLVPEHLEDPLKWRKPRRVFVNSMSDLFHEGLDGLDIARVFNIMAEAKRHTFQVLTKRPQKMRDFVAYYTHQFLNDKPLPNVWLGVSVEDQKTAAERIPLLLQTPAAVRFISAEPLLGPINLAAAGLEIRMHGLDASVETNLHWVICGGESGQGARPMHPAWARSLRDQCEAAGVAFFFKQWGEWGPTDYLGHGTHWAYGRGKFANWIRERGVWHESTIPGGSTVLARVGKKEAGRLLDGRTWDEFPSPPRSA